MKVIWKSISLISILRSSCVCERDISEQLSGPKKCSLNSFHLLLCVSLRLLFTTTCQAHCLTTLTEASNRSIKQHFFPTILSRKWCNSLNDHAHIVPLKNVLFAVLIWTRKFKFLWIIVASSGYDAMTSLDEFKLTAGIAFFNFEKFPPETAKINGQKSSRPRGNEAHNRQTPTDPFSQLPSH